MNLYNFFVCGPKFTRFLLSNAGGVVVVQLRVRFLTCRAFLGYSLSKSKVVRNRAEIWTFFLALPNFREPAFQKLYPRYDPCVAARCMENVL